MSRSQIELVCAFCSKSFFRAPRSFGKNNKQHFCSRECVQKNATKKLTISCSFCKKLFTRKKSHAKTENLFCSSECFSNFRRQTLKHKPCQKCGDIITISCNDYRKVCDKCKRYPKVSSWEEITLSELKKQNNFHSRIREQARKKYKACGLPQECSHCGYNKTFHVAHIKAIQNFSLDSKISEINNINNLIALCPNCHWEFDNGILTKDELTGKAFYNAVKNMIEKGSNIIYVPILHSIDSPFFSFIKKRSINI